MQNKPREQRSTTDLPPALADDGLAAAIRARLSGRRMALFLDYDGTLTPIVERPEQAVLAAEVRQTLRRLARRCPVAVVSGRALADVRALVALETVYYAGSHGYRIEGPTGSGIAHRAGRRFAPAVEQAVAELRRELSGVEGTEVERKAVAVAVHYRRVAGEQHAAVERAVRRVADDHRGQLVLSRGKMVHELRPDIDWHKGKAVLWLLEALDRDGPDGLAIYIGDDTTDEDAFRALAEGDGLGIVVRDAAEPRATAASYALDSPGEVHRFLERVAGALRGVRR